MNSEHKLPNHEESKHKPKNQEHMNKKIKNNSVQAQVTEVKLSRQQSW
jgi:hypothetical protein